MAPFQQQRPQQDNKCKLFVGGLDRSTTEEAITQYFAAYGEPKVNVVMNKETGQSKGFAFLTFSQASLVDDAQASRPHKIDGRALTTTRVLPKDDQGQADNTQVKKLFVARIKGNIEEQNIKDVFKDYGNVLSVAIPIDKETQRQKGFVFVEFDDCDSVDKAMCFREEIIVNGNAVDIKKAFDKAQQAAGGERGGRGGGRGAPRGTMRGGRGGGFYHGGGVDNGFQSSYGNGLGALSSRGGGAGRGAGRGRGRGGSMGNNGFAAAAGYGYEASEASSGYGYEATEATTGYGYGASAAPAGNGFDFSGGSSAGYSDRSKPWVARGGSRGGPGMSRGAPRGRGAAAGGRGGPGPMRGRGRGGQRPQPYSAGY